MTLFFLTTLFLTCFQANPGLYKGVGDGFRTIKAQEGFKGFTVVSLVLFYL
jgi:solute carrier family 25 (mitochondrial phosphate transporter), member 3